MSETKVSEDTGRKKCNCKRHFKVWQITDWECEKAYPVVKTGKLHGLENYGYGIDFTQKGQRHHDAVAEFKTPTCAHQVYKIFKGRKKWMTGKPGDSMPDLIGYAQKSKRIEKRRWITYTGCTGMVNGPLSSSDHWWDTEKDEGVEDIF